MPEIRYIETYDYTDLLPEKRTPDKAKITKTAYEVSDEELAEEKKAQRMANILEKLDALKARLEELERAARFL